MWVYIQTIIISIIIIIIIQYLFYYIRDTFTTKKTKDLVEIQTKKYKSIVEELLDIKSKREHPPIISDYLTDEIIDTLSETETVIDYDTMATNLQEFATNL